MNQIDMRLVKTRYDYPEYYWVIDRKPIVRYLDEYVKAGKCPGLEPFGSLSGLMPAWTGELEWKSDNDFVWEMIDSPDTLNVPVLVCEDDADLSCVVILVRIRKTDRYVYWDKIGVLDHRNGSPEEENRSGIAYLESYTEEDWEKYGDNIAAEQYDSREFWQWVRANWDEEMIRRRRNYTWPYMQKDENVIWIAQTDWVFDAGQYNEMVEKYRRVYREK